MSFATIQTTLVSAFKTAADDPDYDVHWFKTEDGWRNLTHIRLSPVSMRGLGQPERRFDDAGGADDMPERIYQPRIFQIQAVCESYDQNLDGSAWAIAEMVSTNLKGSDVEAILDAGEIAIVRVSDLQPVDYQDADGRERSAVMFEITVSTHSSHTRPDAPRVKAIEVEGTDTDYPIPPFTVTDPTP